jgi:integrase
VTKKKDEHPDILPAIGHVQLRAVTPAMLDNLFQSMTDKGRAHNTVRNVHRVLSVAFETARRYRYIEHNPARDTITRFGKQAKTPDPYTIEQVRQFMGEVSGTNWEFPVVLAGMYGLRIGEIGAMHWRNVDLENMTFDVVEQLPFRIPPGTTTITEMAPTKSNDRTLPITEMTLPYFMRQFELQERQKALLESSGGTYHDNDLVVCKPDGSPHRRDYMSSDFGHMMRGSSMPHIRFHDLRHTAATNMHQLTGDFYTVGEILGHTLKGIGMQLGISTSLEAVTARYVDVRLERKREVLETYHKAIHADTKDLTPNKQDKPAKKKSRGIEL